jgi:hypothetical protein
LPLTRLTLPRLSRLKVISGSEMSRNYEAEIAAFIRSRGVTRCPTAYAAPALGISSEADRVALRSRAKELEVAREEQVRRRRSSRSLQFAGELMTVGRTDGSSIGGSVNWRARGVSELGDPRKMQLPSFGDKRSDSSWKRRIDRTLGEINVVLVALAIGLAVLDTTCFVAFTAAGEIRRAHGWSQQVRPSLSQAWPEWLPFPSTPAMPSATGQKMDPL